MTESTALPSPCVVVLAGVSSSGKTSWAQANFADGVVGSDLLRGLVGEGEDDMAASTDAFEVLDDIIGRRISRRLTTVIDTMGVDAERRAAWIASARKKKMPAVAVVFDLPPAEVRRRNKARDRQVPARVLSAQLKAWPETLAEIHNEEFDQIIEAESPSPPQSEADGGESSVPPPSVRLVPEQLLGPTGAPVSATDGKAALRFGLQIGAFNWTGGTAELGERLAAIAGAAEEVGFESIWVMDHFRQIPQVGRDWDPMLESWSTVSYLAGVTRRARLGVLVSGISHRNIAHLGKIAATVDVLSGGRAVCGIGAAWYEKEHLAYGYPFPPLATRFDMVEDALELLPLLWGKGAPAFEGRTITVPEAICYPRPIQDPIPMLVGGGGEQRTLALVARYADACNLQGDVETVRHKLKVLARHCEAAERDIGEIEVTHLSTAMVASSAADLRTMIDAARPKRVSAERFAARANAAIATDQVDRYRTLADAGVDTAIVALNDLDGPDAVQRFGEVIEAFT